MDQPTTLPPNNDQAVKPPTPPAQGEMSTQSEQTLTPPPPKEVPSEKVQNPDDEGKTESLANRNLSGSIEEDTQKTSSPIKPSSAYIPKFNPAILTIVGGVIVLIAAGIAYYSLVLNKQPSTTPEETPPMETQDTGPDVTTKPPVDIVDDTEQVNISDDKTIQELDTVVESNDLKEIEDTLNSLDFEGIDTEIQQSNF